MEGMDFFFVFRYRAAKIFVWGNEHHRWQKIGRLAELLHALTLLGHRL
jgi:hypothetical protein